MDCSSTAEEEHKLLAEVTFLARKSRQRLFAMDNNRVLRDLADDGYVERIADGAYHLLVACTCEQMKRATATHRGAKTRSSEQPELTQQTLDDDLSEATSVGSRKKKGGAESKAHESALSVSQPLRSRGGSGLLFGEQSTDSSYSQLAGKTVSGRRTATEVADKLRRANTPSAWQDKPVERWNAVNLAGYLSSQAWDRCKGLSPDLYNTAAQTKLMRRLLAFGISREDLKRMVDIYLDRVESNKVRVPSLWKEFFALVPDLQVLLTSNATKRYTNQPTTSAADKEYL